ncbi:hypothetical protein RIF29_03599 [Crotalaria pallida]|uniref:phosphoethanolamine N-methyltransferase n=1 Tax=Crotalaria pallida TaxID=3830 RepID=A0AAN9P9X4_CROPI
MSYLLKRQTSLSFERPDDTPGMEVLSLLPAYEGKSVLELGAGIGRFTAELAPKAAQLLAVDFIENAIKKWLH